MDSSLQLYMSPLTCMQVDCKSWSKVKLRLKMKNFMKEYVSLIQPLSTIFTVAVGRILKNSQQCMLPQRSKWLLAQTIFIDYLLYDTYSNHITASESFSITHGYIRNSQPLQNLKVKYCLWAKAVLITETTFPKLLGRCATTTWIMNCEETTSECLPYACTAFKIMQISSSLNFRDWLLKCVSLKVLIFKCLLVTLL
jgi:hypothetical protein